LARAEAGDLLRGYVTGIAVALMGLAAMIVALLVLALTCVDMLAPHVNGQASAGFIVSLVLLVAVGVLALMARHQFTGKIRPAGLILRWLSGNGLQTGKSA
jgi:hypothetical protein